jgi:hypothetical protein
VKVSFFNAGEYENNPAVTVDLHSTTTHHSQVIQVALPQGDLSEQNINLVVIDRTAGTPQIEGLGISAD